MSGTVFGCGFLWAFISGILGSMLNLGLAYGGSIQRAAQQHGASLAMMSNAVWLPCLYAGFLPGAIYCYILMRKRDNVSALRLARHLVLLAGRSQHGISVVWQHHSLQHLDGEVG